MKIFTIIFVVVSTGKKIKAVYCAKRLRERRIKSTQNVAHVFKKAIEQNYKHFGCREMGQSKTYFN